MNTKKCISYEINENEHDEMNINDINVEMVKTVSCYIGGALEHNVNP